MSKISEGIILVGGKGTRLRSVTMNEIPKALTKIGDKSILEWEMNWYAKNGFQHLVLATGHLAEKIEQHFGRQFETEFGSIELSYSVEKEKLGSGGAIKQAGQYTSSDQIAISNGDVLTNFDFTEMKEMHEKMNVLATMLAVNMTSPYGILHIKESIITAFEEKPRLNVPIHAGVDIINSTIIQRFPDKGQMEDTIFLDLVEEKQFAVYQLSDEMFWMSIDTQKDFELANETWTGLS